MSQRDAASGWIGLFSWETQITNNGQGLRGKGFVYFEDVDLIGGLSGSIE
jgi:hypothetical protein